MMEPILRPEDIRTWDGWMRAAKLHQRSALHRARVDDALRIVEKALDRGSKRSLSLSGGKDSSAAALLVSMVCGKDIDLVSEKDDLDYPGEEEHVREVAARCGAPLTIVRPPISPTEWLDRRASAMSGCDDMHSKKAGLSKACFYGVMEDAEAGYEVTFWGLRAEESRRRRDLILKKGRLYTLKSGVVRCHPLGHWKGIDVFAFLEKQGLDPLPVYKCCGWLPEHRANPALIRKSWWIPGAHAAKGQAAWLKHYYPSLFERFRQWFPDASSFC